MKNTALYLVALLVLIAISTTDASSQRRRTTASRLKELPTKVLGPGASLDTIACNPGDLTFSGYDKRLWSSRESMFVTNHTSSTIVEIVFHIEYFDMQGRRLHSQRCTSEVGILTPGNTVYFTIPTWDKQRSFYFHGSQKPRVSGVPYSVKIDADSIITLRPAE